MCQTAVEQFLELAGQLFAVGGAVRRQRTNEPGKSSGGPAVAAAPERRINHGLFWFGPAVVHQLFVRVPKAA